MIVFYLRSSIIFLYLSINNISILTHTLAEAPAFGGLTCYGASYTSDFYNPHCYPVEAAF